MCRDEKFSSCETVEGAEAADGWFPEIFDVENILEGKFFQANGGESGKFGACERPGHLSFGVGRFAASGDDEQESAQAKEPCKIFDRTGAKSYWKDLERVGLKDKMESMAPGGWRFEQVGGAVFHCRPWEAFARSADGGFRDVEGGGAESPGGKLLGIVAEAAADGQRCFSRGWL